MPRIEPKPVAPPPIGAQLVDLQTVFLEWIRTSRQNHARKGQVVSNDSPAALVVGSASWPTHAQLTAWAALMLNAAALLTARNAEARQASSLLAKAGEAVVLVPAGYLVGGFYYETEAEVKRVLSRSMFAGSEDVEQVFKRKPKD